MNRRLASIGILALGGLTGQAALAQTAPNNAPWNPGPIAQPAFDARSLDTPRAKTLTAGGSASVTTDLKFSKGIGVGQYRIELDAKHSTEAVRSGLATDSGETANLSKVFPGQKPVKALPNYFGLKLSAPTQ